MRGLIISFFIATNLFAQTSINNLTLKTTGRLGWDLSIKEGENLKISLQKQISNKWITIYNREVIWGALVDNSGPLPSNPIPVKFIDSCFAPFDKGINEFRIILKSFDTSKQLISNVISVNRDLAVANKLIANGDFINLDDYYTYEVLDSNGSTISTVDRSNFINISGLKKGLYYINFGSDGIHLFEKYK